MTHQVQGVLSEIFKMVSGTDDNGYYYYSVCASEVVALIIIIFAISYQCPISTTQTCIFSMLGSSLAQIIYGSDTYNKISWTILCQFFIVWAISPILTIFVSCIVYLIIQKIVLSGNAKIKSFIITPYISGMVFVIYISFIFTTPIYQNLLTNTNQFIVVPIVLLIGLYIGIVFKRAHFFRTKVTPPMKACNLIKQSLCIL